MPRVPFDPATDYYGLLGVTPSASTEEIQAAYRRLAKAYHPDLNAGSSIAAARMARVNVAKSVLLDAATRESYDQLRASRARAAAPSGRARHPHRRHAARRQPGSPDRHLAADRPATPGGAAGVRLRGGPA